MYASHCGVQLKDGRVRCVIGLSMGVSGGGRGVLTAPANANPNRQPDRIGPPKPFLGPRQNRNRYYWGVRGKREEEREEKNQ